MLPLFWFSFMIKWITMIFCIVLVIFSIACLFMKNEPSRDMKSKFESGIDQNEQEFNHQFLHFFYVGILFLIFDVEVVLSIPMIQSSLSIEKSTFFWVVFMILVILGLLVEILEGSVNWKE